MPKPCYTVDDLIADLEVIRTNYSGDIVVCLPEDGLCDVDIENCDGDGMVVYLRGTEAWREHEEFLRLVAEEEAKQPITGE